MQERGTTEVVQVTMRGAEVRKSVGVSRNSPVRTNQCKQPGQVFTVSTAGLVQCGECNGGEPGNRESTINKSHCPTVWFWNRNAVSTAWG